MPNDSTPERTAWTILKLVRWTTDYFNRHHIENARNDAEVLLAHALKVRRIDLYLNHDKPLSEAELGRFRELIRRRRSREPVAYITGMREFWSLELKVDPAVLIPRPETECLVEAALPLLETGDDRPRRVLELGTGSGAIVIALAHERAQHRYVAMDRSPAALQLARENARRHGCETRIAWFCGDWDGALKHDLCLFDLIVSNPPYIPSGDIDGLQPEIQRYEPRTALDGSADGLACLGRIIQAAPRLLANGGWLALEMGCHQAAPVRALSEAAGSFKETRIVKDYSGLDRVAMMRKGG